MSSEKTYPWLRLLELEFEGEPKPVKRKRPGRPKNPFPRKRYYVGFTDDERDVLDELVRLLSEKMGRSISRGHLIAFMAFRLQSQLQQEGDYEIGEQIDSFVSLAKYLDAHPRG